MTIFEKNLQALVNIDPTLAARIFSIKTNENFEVVQQGDDPINLNLIDKKHHYPIYETNPLKEINQKLEELKKLERLPVKFFFGIGNGILTKLLFANPTHTHIFVFEPNIEILYIALNIVDLSEEIESKKLQIIIPNEYTYAQAISIFENPDISVYSKLYTLHIHSKYYEKFYSNEILQVNKLNIRAIKQSINNLGNDTIDTLIGIEHHIKNTPEMIKNIPFKKFGLKNKGKLSDTAIIVSTGPSLSKQLPLLKEALPYATIISVDASLPILAKHNIKPDFVTSLERVEATAKFFENTPPEFQKDIIMIHASLQHEKVLKNSHGIKCLVMRPFFFTRNLGLNNYGFLGIGMSAANMAYELAYVLGFKKIVLIGQDLAYSEDGLSHATGHVLGEDEVKFSDSDTYVTAYGGKGLIRTSKNWNMFRNFFERDIATSKKEGVVTINATEGGARIEGALELPFKEVVKELKTAKKPIKIVKPTEKEINKYLLKAHKKYKEIYVYGTKFQKRVETLFLKVAKECEKLEKLKEENRLEEINYKKLQELSNQIDKIKDKIETKKFFSMYGETIQSVIMHQEMELAKVQISPSNTEIEKKAKLIDWIMKHKVWLFDLAGTINAQRIVIKRSIPLLEEELRKRGIKFEPL